MLHIQNVTRKPRGNRFCGPAAISALTGLDTDQTAALIREISGRRQVTGTRASHMLDVLSHCGLSAARVPGANRQTLAAWLANNEYRLNPGRVYLIVAGHHWQLVECDSYVCGIVKEVVPVTHKKVKRRARVTEVYEVSGDYKHPDLLDRIEAKKAKRKAELAAVAPAKRALLKAKADGIVEWDYWDRREDPPSIIYPGEALRGLDDEDDPYDGDHTCDLWEDAVKMIEIYRELAKYIAA